MSDEEHPNESRVPRPELAEPKQGILQATGDPEPVLADAATARAGELPRSKDSDAEQASLDFLWKIHGYVNEYIRFADTKAAFTITLAVAVLGGLLSSGVHRLVVLAPPSQWTLLESAAGASMFLLAISVFLGGCAIWPRFWRRGAGEGHIFWGAIVEQPNANAFWAGIRNRAPENLTEAVAHHVYSLANVCARKYSYVSLSMGAAFVGAVLGALALVWL